MFLIECFTDSHIDNITACLRLRPRKLVFLGDEEVMRRDIKRYRSILQKRGQHTEIISCHIGGKDFEGICTSLRQLLRTAEDCVIDLTGGDTLVVMAIGAVVAELDSSSRKRVHVQKHTPSMDTVQDCMNNSTIPGKRAALSVEELIALHGGSLQPNSFQPPADFAAADLDPLWQIVADAPKDWNRAISLLAEFESRADSKTQVYLPLSHLRSSIQNFAEKESVVSQLLEQFHARGIIDDRSNGNGLEYTYTSPMFRYCTLKAGNVLEVKTLLEARALLDHGAPYFQDCRMSVSIDWDGIIYDPARRIPETRNEIDVVAMHGVMPLFISCKNGNIGEEELYKLHTVATRFAGPHAKKMLIATDLDQKSAGSNRSFIQRAWDMDIFLVTDAAELSKEEWRQIFRQAMN